MKRKIAFLSGYNGKGYCGLQWNKDTNTIEKTFIDIFLKNNLIKEINSKEASKIDLKSSSRTDKGVHATFNVIVAKIEQEPSEELFLKLKEQFEDKRIKLYKMIKIPKSFMPHKAARSRIYKYVVPTYFLKEGNYNEEYLKIMENDKISQSENSYENMDEHSKGVENDKISQSENSREIEDAESLEIKDDEKCHKIFRDYNLNNIIIDIKGHKSENIDFFRKLMNIYEGTKSYHNFTVKSNSKSAKRFIREISVSEPFYNNDIEYVTVKIHGQSFLLHQIRKMISFAVLNCRYSKDNAENNFDRAFNDYQHIPKGPSAYLYLNKVFFDDFNKYHEDKLEVDDKEVAEFENSKILPEILKDENLIEWLVFLDSVRFHHRHFDIFKS